MKDIHYSCGYCANVKGPAPVNVALIVALSPDAAFTFNDVIYASPDARAVPAFHASG